MNICFVTTEFLEKGKPTTGLPNYLYRLSKELQKMGHTPIILTASDRDSHTYYNEIEIFKRRCTLNKTFQCGEIKYLMTGLKMSYLLNDELHKMCKKRKIDIVHFTSLNGLALFYHEKIPAIIRLSSYAKKTFEYSKVYTKKEIQVFSFLERIASYRVEGIISPSRIIGEAYAKDVRRKVTIIESPFDKKDITYDESIYEELFIGKKYILFFGSLYDVKGIFTIIKGIKGFLRKNPQYSFGIVGNVENYSGENPLRELYKEAGEYVGQIIYSKALCHEQLYPIISHAEVIIMPSLMENLSNACIEAMSLGKIVVGTEGASFEQLICDGKSGFLSTPGDEKSLYNKIEEALSLGEEEKRQIERRAIKRMDLLRPEITVQKLINYYYYICGKSKD